MSKKVVTKVLTCNSAKQLWDKLGTIYAGDSKVRREKLQTLKAQFEGLKMKEKENICQCFERIGTIVNAVRGLGQNVLDDEIVDKVLRTFPMVYNPKVSTLEDREDIDKLTFDELYGILIAYELRIGRENHSKEETTLKYSRRQRTKNKNFNSVLKMNLMIRKKPTS